MGLSSLTQSLEGVHPENLANFNFTMFRFVALFAFVAVAAAEPQWGLEHMKTPSGDTVSVQAAKVQHHQMKTAEYVKKGYASPIVYANSAAYAPYSGGSSIQPRCCCSSVQPWCILLRAPPS